MHYVQSCSFAYRSNEHRTRHAVEAGISTDAREYLDDRWAGLALISAKSCVCASVLQPLDASVFDHFLLFAADQGLCDPVCK